MNLYRKIVEELFRIKWMASIVLDDQKTFMADFGNIAESIVLDQMREEVRLT